jgi:hypothetical protein
MIPTPRTEKAISNLRALAHDTTIAAGSHRRLDRIRAAQVGIERSPFVDQLLRDYTDAMFRNTERILTDIRARAA